MSGRPEEALSEDEMEEVAAIAAALVVAGALGGASERERPKARQLSWRAQGRRRLMASHGARPASWRGRRGLR
jgi:hypothetical protein